ncbi:DASS family sodium-coupled anion symporter [Halomonas sp. HAL1]|uniref:DASS family sodium-coupled anion symporter n=1 Tax=Halomonas sp. HAL1 TaxID=550984 RepID=UPI00022D2E0C|nr:DASS family sodium-coupled anion symporter [Halomonas sp. HAL1]EHA15751.1 anion transporter [Halomonas sp. HAL1]WKV93969.1 DASS family sodium-coupled anion symporter [Halomonas sp. HAL1]|tara:strand:- start:476 stop:1942 length:1467 start_codon:yes stop_codon:yes gene_type:complete
MTKLPFKPWPTVTAVAMTLLIWLAVPLPEGLTSDAWLMLAIFVGTIAAIIGKAMPIGAISIIAISIVAASGVTSDNPGTAINDALSSYSNSLIWLIAISIMISRGLIKTGLGARIGYYFISIFGKKTLGIGYSLAFSELCIAPVTPSNTARGGGIMHPIMRSIAKGFDSRPEEGTSNKIGKYLALVNYHSNPITSAMFVTATAPNPLTVQLISIATGAEIQLSWMTWAIAMLLPGLVAILCMPLALYWLYPPEIKETPNATKMARDKLTELGKLSRNEGIMLFVFLVLLLLWADIPALFLGESVTLNTTTSAFIGLSILLLTGVLNWDDVLAEKNAWDTLLWFGALIMMATQLNQTGLIDWFSTNMQDWITMMGIGWMGASTLLVLTFLYTHYFFASTTAHITAMMAAFLTVGLSLGAPPMPFVLIMAATSSIMMTLTHYATGTSPVIFGSGYLTLGEWWKAGFIMSVVNLAIWVLVGGLWWKLLGHY